MPVSVEQPTFAGGEISPHLHARRDLNRYRSALRTARNFVVLPQGATTRRPGTRYVASTKANGLARLVPFVFSEDDAQALEIGQDYTRVFAEQAQVDNGGSPLEFVTPWQAGDLPNLQWTQSADVLYCVSGALPVKELRRTGATTWVVADFAAENGPFAPQNLDTAVTVKASAGTGSVTLTASAAVFAAEDVGTFFMLAEVDQDAVAEWTGATTVTAGDRMRSLGRVYEVISGTSTGVNPPNHTEGDALSEKGGVVWRAIHDGTGVLQITAFASATSVTATVIGELPDNCVDPEATYRWRKAAWNSVRGYPRTILSKEQRLWFGGTDAEPLTVWTSAVGLFQDFRPGITAADSFDYTLNGARGRQNNIRWLHDAQVLMVGTEGEEHIGQASAANEALTPENLVIRPHSARGGARLQPETIGTTAVFVSRARTKLYEISFDFETERFSPRDISLMSEHILRSGIKETAWQSEPYGMLWCVMNDGTLGCMTFEEHEQVLAWTPHDSAGGKFLSVCVLPGGAGKPDDVYFIVERTVDDATVRYVEVLQQRFEDDAGTGTADAAWYLDCALRTTFESPVTAVSGLDHLEGRTVHIWADGAAQPAQVVAEGAISLQIAASTVLVGLDYGGELSPLAIPVGPDGAPMDKRKVVRALAHHLYQTVGGLVFGAEGQPDELVAPSGGRRGAPLAHFTGVRETVVRGDWSTDPRVSLKPSPGAPMTVLSIEPVVDVSEG